MAQMPFKLHLISSVLLVAAVVRLLISLNHPTRGGSTPSADHTTPYKLWSHHFSVPLTEWVSNRPTATYYLTSPEGCY